MNDVIAFMHGDITLFVFCSNKLQPVKHIAIRRLLNKLAPFTDIIGAQRFIARFPGYNRVRKMYIGVNKFLRFAAGGAAAAGVGSGEW